MTLQRHATRSTSTLPSTYHPGTGPRFVSQNREYLAALARLERYATFEHAVVLIEGESGTGKTYFAEHLHRSSPRQRGPYHCVVLSTLDDNLAASDLFGHVSGAYTDARHSRPGCFSTANGGTLFLDEIGKASPSVQRKLLHAIEHREIWPVGTDRPVRIDVRLVAATNVSLDQLVAEGKFLPDLVARLNSFRIRIPPLRERQGDIPALIQQCLELRASRCGYNEMTPRFDQRLLDLLKTATWPNNLRQLDATVQRLLIHAEGAGVITLEHLGEGVVDLGLPGEHTRLTAEHVREVVASVGSKARAARVLGVTRQTVHRYLTHEQSESRPARAD